VNKENGAETHNAVFCLIIIVGAMIGPAITILLDKGKLSNTGPVAVVFPPWWTGSEAIVAAASVGSIIRTGALPTIIVVAPNNGDYGRELWRQGAWFTLDARKAGGCLKSGPLKVSS
jgi:hypothetical protein